MTKLLIKFLCLALISVSYTANAGTLFLDISGHLDSDNNQQTSNIKPVANGWQLEIEGIQTRQIIRNFSEVSGLNAGIEDKVFETRDVSIKLKLDRKTGEVSGKSRGLITDLTDEPEPYHFETRLKGHFNCIDPGVKRCRLMIVDMKSIGVIFDDTDGAERVAAGTITEQLIGALFEDPNFESRLLDSTGTYSLHYISN